MQAEGVRNGRAAAIVSHDGLMSKGNILLNARFPQNLFLGLRSFPWWIKHATCDQWKLASHRPVKRFVSGCALRHSFPGFCFVSLQHVCLEA